MARLQQELYNLGIEESVNNLSQADKALLRYVAAIKQTTNAQGDMARTIMTPANALRVLEAQLNLAARAIGSIFIPALTSALPYVIAFVKVIGEAASALAAFFGFEMPQIDYSSVGSGLGDISSGLDDVGDSAAAANKQMNKLIGGFDELNILQDKASGGGSAAGGIGSILGDITLPQYDMFGKGVQSQIDKITKSMRKFLNEFKNSAAVKLVTKVLGTLWNDIIKPFGLWAAQNPDTIANVLVAIGAAILTYKLVTGIGNLVSGFSGLAKAVGSTGLIAGLKTLGGIFTNPWALAIAAVAAAITLVGLAIYNAWEDAKRADLEGRFGDIALSMEEVKQVAKSLTTSDLTIKIDAYFDEKETLSSMYDSLNTISETLYSQTWKLSLGIDVDLEEYSNNIDSFIQQAQDTLTQQHLVYTLAIELGFSNADVKTEMTRFVNRYYEESQGEMERLGKELRSTIDNALADGILSDEELQTITNLQSEMNQIVQKMADAEYKAKLTSLSLDFSGTDLTSESFQNVMEQANSILEEQMQQVKDIRLDSLKLAELKFAEDGNQTAYQSAIQDIEKTFNQNKLDLQLQVNDFGTEAIYTAFNEDLKNVVPSFTDSLQDNISQGISAANLSGEWGKFFLDIEYDIYQGFEKLKPETRNNLIGLLQVLEPQAQQYEEIAKSYTDLGQMIPDSISGPLTDIYTLRALAGDAGGIYNLVGQTLAKSSPEAIAMIDEAKKTGLIVPDEFTNGIYTNQSAVNGAAKDILDGITTTFKLNEGSLMITVKALGASTDANMVSGIHDGLSSVNEAGKDLMRETYNGAEAQLNTDKSKWGGLFGGIVDWAQNLIDNLFGSRQYNKVSSGRDFGGVLRPVPRTYATVSDPSMNPLFRSANAISTLSAEGPSEYAGYQSTYLETGRKVVEGQNGRAFVPVNDADTNDNAILDRLDQLIQAVQENGVEIAPDSKGIFRLVKKEARDEYKRSGEKIFT